MQTIRCLIVDDEPLAIQLISRYVSRIPFLEIAGTIPNGTLALERIKQGDIDLVLLDIQLPDISGVTLMQLLWQQCHIILITAYPQHALEAYAWDVIDYLLKPVNFHRFAQAADRVKKRMETTSINRPPQDYLFVKVGYQLQKISFKTITHIKGNRDYITFYTHTDKVIASGSLREMENSLPSRLFLRIHKSYIINKSFISQVEKKKVHLGNLILPVGEHYRESFEKDCL